MRDTSKGFTLIELLAVIVILAIIALIATPIVLKLIDKAKKGAAESDAYAYVNAIETSAVDYLMHNHDASVSGIYTVKESGTKLVGDDNGITLTPQIKGNKPEDGTKITLNNNGIVSDVANMKINDYNVVYDKDTKKFRVDEESSGGSKEVKTCILKSGTALAIGSEYECTVADGFTYTFYVIEVTTDKVSLIMNRNFDNTTVAWVSKDDYIAAGGTEAEEGTYGNNNKGPITVTAKLIEETNSWSKVDKVSLPTEQQIANVVNKTTWMIDGDVFLTGLPNWLYNNLSTSSAPYGYWTSTLHSYNSSDAWCVIASGKMIYNGVHVNFYGIRPVITVSKSKI